MPEVNQPHNVDSILTAPAGEVSVTNPVPIITESVPESTPEPEISSTESADPYGADDQKPAEKPKVEEKSDSSPIDEYGNPLEKPRLYTEEEVQQRIRERLLRVKTPENNQAQQNLRNEAQNFQADPNNSDSWEKQLSDFIDHHLEQRHTEQNNRRWKEQEDRRQAEFEGRFHDGMRKYADFEKVVAGKPITDSMLMGIRSLENPAAFVYAAAKLHPKEIERIAQINDPAGQALEVGRLHERMIKEKRLVSQSSRPLQPPVQDMPTKMNNQPSLEQRIHDYAKAKRK